MTNHPCLAAVTMLVLGTILFVDVPSAQREPTTKAERARIQTHLERVERELRSRDVMHLSPSQRAARTRNLNSLRDYRQRGVFPHNHDFGDRRMPYFVDRHGTRCAMAHLIERSGGSDLVRRVATTGNNARVRELAGDPELLAWLEREGLTVDEAASIQPEYGYLDVPPVHEDEWNVPYTAGTGAVSALGITAILLNTTSPFDLTDHRHGRERGAFAFTTGIVGLGLGLPALTRENDKVRGLGVLNTCIGAATLLVGVTVLTSTADPSETTSAQVTPRGVTLSAAPLIARGPECAHGAALRLRF